MRGIGRERRYEEQGVRGGVRNREGEEGEEGEEGSVRRSYTLAMKEGQVARRMWRPHALNSLWSMASPDFLGTTVRIQV